MRVYVTHVILFFTVSSPNGTVEVTPKNPAVDHFTNVTFTCQSDAGSNLNYTWLYNDATPNNDAIVINDSQLTVNNVTYLLGGTYTCVVSNIAGEGRNSSDLYGKIYNKFALNRIQSK